MKHKELRRIADEIEASEDGANGHDAMAMVALQGLGLDTAGVSGGGASALSSDTVLTLIGQALPGWTLKLDGTASLTHGHWTCVLRQAHNEVHFGVGKNNALPQALLAALLRAMANKAV